MNYDYSTAQSQRTVCRSCRWFAAGTGHSGGNSVSTRKM